MENNIMEQPDLIENSAENKVNEPIIEEKEVSDATQLELGSTYGKFKDATSLLEAYNNLEKEFTKKSQKLSELLKSQDETKQTEEHNTQIETNILPKYKQSNWRVEVERFFTENPDAKKYSKDISQIIMNDKSLSNSENCLNYAYALASKNAYIEPAKLLDDPNYIDSLATNEKIRSKVISTYLQNIMQEKSNIKVISGEPNSVSPTPPAEKPKNLKEASSILKKLLQS